MEINGYQGQITAASQPNYSFLANADIMPLIINDYKNIPNKNNKLFYLERIGIQAQPETVVLLASTVLGENNINGNQEQRIKIGKTGLYEANDVHIIGIKFEQNTLHDVIIDYIIKFDEGV